MLWDNEDKKKVDPHVFYWIAFGCSFLTWRMPLLGKDNIRDQFFITSNYLVYGDRLLLICERQGTIRTRKRRTNHRSFTSPQLWVRAFDVSVFVVPKRQ